MIRKNQNPLPSTILELGLEKHQNLIVFPVAKSPTTSMKYDSLNINTNSTAYSYSNNNQ